jgi:hypothetical protein
MSLMRRIALVSGVYSIYSLFRQMLFQRMLLPFATEGQISLEEAVFLGELTREARGDGPIVEIGALFGSSTKVILLNKAREQPVLAVDLFSWNPAHLTPKQHYTVTTLGLRAFAGESSGLRIIQVDKNEFYRTYTGPTPALVFLDAVHSYEETRRDIQWAKASGAPIICGHDYSSDWPGVMKAVGEAGGVSKICGTLWRLN